MAETNSEWVAGAYTTPTQKTTMDAARKKRGMTQAAVNREAWDLWIAKQASPAPTPTPTPTPAPATLDLRTQPFSVSYKNGSFIYTPEYAKPGGMVVANQYNIGQQVFKDISAAGGTVLAYFDAVVMSSGTKYHDLLWQDSVHGPALTPWGILGSGPVKVNVYGNLADFRAGYAMHTPSRSIPQWTKLEAVLEQYIAENPHIGGIFADDLGTMSWFPNLVWRNVPTAAKSEYRAGAIAVATTMRRVCDRHGLILVVNGTWQEGAVEVSGGAYPTASGAGHGCGLAEGLCWEGHDPSDFGRAYITGAQWGSLTPMKGKGIVSLVIAETATGRDTWAREGKAAFVTLGPNYDEQKAWGAIHATGLPSKVRG